MNCSRYVIRVGAAGALLAASFLLGSSRPSRCRAMTACGASHITEKGDCDRGYRYPIRISNGSLINAGDFVFKVGGNVNPNGAITVSVSAGGKSANGSGKLAGDSGGGSGAAANAPVAGPRNAAAA